MVQSHLHRLRDMRGHEGLGPFRVSILHCTQDGTMLRAHLLGPSAVVAIGRTVGGRHRENLAHHGHKQLVAGRKGNRLMESEVSLGLLLRRSGRAQSLLRSQGSMGLFEQDFVRALRRAARGGGLQNASEWENLLDLAGGDVGGAGAATRN